MIQHFIVAFVIVAALALLARRFLASFANRACGCDACPVKVPVKKDSVH
jgi:hypothetical protein